MIPRPNIPSTDGAASVGNEAPQAAGRGGSTRRRLTADDIAKGTAARMAQRAEGLAFARRWRETQPARAMLDAIYGPEPAAAVGHMPFRDC